jgi:hypothetical protein
MKKTKSKYPDHVMANMRWFIKYRHEFNFSGSNSYLLYKVDTYRYLIGSEEKPELEYMSTMSWASFCAAYNHDPKANYLPTWERGKNQKYDYVLQAYTEPMIVHDVNGVDAFDAFIAIDSYGTAKPTRHPRLLENMLRTKASLNLHIQMYAQDRANGRLPKVLFQSEIVEPFEFLPWMVEAVENQKVKYY